MSYSSITEIFPSAGGTASTDTTVGALTAATTAVIGNTVGTNTHLFLRFDTSVINANDEIFSAALQVFSSAVAGTPKDLVLWASEFPSGVIRYNLNKRNHASPIRVPIATIIAGSASATASGQVAVPSRFINKGSGQVSDFEIRPSAQDTSGTNTRTIGGVSNASGGGVVAEDPTGIFESGPVPPTTTNQKPRLLVYHYNPLLKNAGTVSGTSNTLQDSGLAITANDYVGATLKIVKGTGTGYIGTVVSNTTNTFTVAPDFSSSPTSTTEYVVELSIPDPCVAPTGAESYVGFDIEYTCGSPVKAKILLDVTGSDLDTDAENLVSRAFRKERAAPAKTAVGRAGGGGTISFEFTPEKCFKLLRGFFKLYNTVDASGNSNSGVADLYSGAATNNVAPSVAPYTKTFTVAQSPDISFYTFVQKESPFSRSLYSGCVLGSLSISASLDSLVDGAVSVLARDVHIYDDNSAGGGKTDPYILSSSAGYDSGLPLSFVGSEISFNGSIDNTCVQNASISFSNNAGERRGLRRNRGVRGHYVGKLTASVSFTMYFENHNALRKFLGVNHTDFPYSAEKNLTFDNVDIRFAGPSGEASEEFIIRIPKLSYTVVRRPVASEGPIYLDASGIANYDSATGNNVIIFLKNSEPASAWDASTDLVTVLAEYKKF